MGYSQVWLAVRGAAVDSLHDAFEARPTEEREEFPESSLVAAALRDGWYLVVANGWNSKMFDEQFLASLSSGVELIVSSVEEHVMSTHTSHWANGVRDWHVEYLADGRPGLTALQTDGKLPAGFDAICAECEAADPGGADWVFDIPVELARAAVGYRYDETPEVPGEPLPFVVLASTAPGPRGAFSRLRDYLSRRAKAKRDRLLAEYNPGD